MLTLDIRTLHLDGEQISVEDVRDAYAHHSGSYVSKKLDRSLPREVPLLLSVVADNKPVLDSKPNTSNWQWGTRSASNPPGPMFFGLARVSDAPAVSWSPDSANHFNSGTSSMNPLLEEALLSTLSWLLCRRQFQHSSQELAL